MSSYRIDRISEEVKRELSELIRELKDPRLHPLTSIVKADVTKDLRFAKVYVSVLAEPEERAATIEGLKGAAGHLRKELCHRVSLRYTPELIFKLDNSIEQGAHINQILGELDERGRSHERDN